MEFLPSNKAAESETKGTRKDIISADSRNLVDAGYRWTEEYKKHDQRYIMTAAVCFKCGAMKTGAWTPCDACGTMPRTENDLVLSMALSDKHPKMDLPTLQRLGKHIYSGKSVDVDAASRANILKMIRSLPPAQKELARQMGITAFDEKPLKTEGNMKDKFADTEWIDIRKFPFFIMCYVASADNKIDVKELQMITGFFLNKDACPCTLLRECLIDIGGEVIDLSKRQVILDLVRSDLDNDPKLYIHRCVNILKKRLSANDFGDFVMNVFVMGARVANMTKNRLFDGSKIGAEELSVLNSLAPLFEFDQVIYEELIKIVKTS